MVLASSSQAPSETPAVGTGFDESAEPGDQLPDHQAGQQRHPFLMTFPGTDPTPGNKTLITAVCTPARLWANPFPERILIHHYRPGRGSGSGNF